MKKKKKCLTGTPTVCMIKHTSSQRGQLTGAIRRALDEGGKHLDSSDVLGALGEAILDLYPHPLLDLESIESGHQYTGIRCRPRSLISQSLVIHTSFIRHFSHQRKQYNKQET